MVRMQTTHYVHGTYEVKTGAVVPVNTNLEALRFAFTASCESMDPQLWRGRVALDGKTLLETEPVASYDEAGSLVQRQWRDRLVHLFAQPPSTA